MPVARLCSRNLHKLEELRAALPDWTLELLEVDGYPDESGATYYENARAKACFGRSVGPVDEWMLGEDTGIEVHALGGNPGVRSARWATDGPAQVLEELAASKDRRARLVTEIVCISPEGIEFHGRGELQGTIATERRGLTGFGYDPIFVPRGETITIAELGPRWKSIHSSRARVAAELRAAVPAPNVTS